MLLKKKAEYKLLDLDGCKTSQETDGEPQRRAAGMTVGIISGKRSKWAQDGFV